jgi:hypothetical protein
MLRGRITSAISAKTSTNVPPASPFSPSVRRLTA